ncbi:peroxide stress protein YaaA [Lentisphaera marina]|uniref:peroxide stress protein YaaA n=1 Tax=Lentisphaera marina TaxID=1111041 RepID=UPI002365FF90|nr:peroxide stress protein YaaA [Lentisphaera marina]MDD7983493.1 peroxide stress protein YaaA [Lentisphaera marina]
MLCVVSPAKTLDYESQVPTDKISQPQFVGEAGELIKELRKLNAADIANLMKLSEKLSTLNELRFLEWNEEQALPGARQAVFAFKGDVYTGMDPYSFNEQEVDLANQHLRILSGLYGLLKPMDLIHPYRLEMGTKFANSKGKNLYEFWGDKITDAINAELEVGGHSHFVNLASNEYFKSVKKKNLARPMIEVDFLDWKNDKYKIISFYAKKARGMMAAYIIKNDLKKPEDLMNFDTAGYAYCPERSTEDKYIFTRKQ